METEITDLKQALAVEKEVSMNLLTQYQAVQSCELDKQYLENVISDNLKQIDHLKDEIQLKDDEIKNLKWKVSSNGEG